MTHTCCPACRLRFTRAAASGLGACPSCGELLFTAPTADVLGLHLWTPEGDPPALPDLGAAIAVAVQPPSAKLRRLR